MQIIQLSPEQSSSSHQTANSKQSTMKHFIILFAILVAVSAQRIIPEYRAPENNIPIPYSFNYAADLEDGGRSSHEEAGDGNGRVQGSYTVQGEDGYGRIVDYIADENGFRATVRTNEPGTASQNPADVVMESTFDGQAVRNAPINPPTAGRPGVRYVLVPITDPRAAGYY